MSHEAVVASYVTEGDSALPDGEFGSGIQVVCECGAILIDEDEDELLPFSEISSAVRSHQESHGA